MHYWFLGDDKHITCPKDMSTKQLTEAIVYVEGILKTGYSRQMQRACNKALRRFRRELNKRSIL